MITNPKLIEFDVVASITIEKSKIVSSYSDLIITGIQTDRHTF